jgi:tetratricopeptide (TPR) repeat protein
LSMYLRGSRWRMQRERTKRRVNPALIGFILLMAASVCYFNQYVAPTLPLPKEPTQTPTQDSESFVSAAVVDFDEGNILQAISNYEQAIIADPANPAIYIELARMQVFAGRYEAAKTSVSNALLLSPDNPTALSILGWTLNFLGERDQAKAVLERALQLDPNNAIAHGFLAEVLADQEQFELAAEESRKAVELNGGLLEVRRSRGYVLELTGNYEEAAFQYEAALAINDRIADLHLALGRVYRAMERYEDAINEFVVADSLNPTDSLPNTYTGLIYITTGEFGKAVQAMLQAASEEPSNPFRYANLGVAYYRNRQPTEAMDALNLAIRGGTTTDGIVVNGILLDSPDVVPYFYIYGLLLARANRCSEALPISQALIASVPDDEVAVSNAEEMVAICEEVSNNPPTATPLAPIEPTRTAEPMFEATATY